MNSIGSHLIDRNISWVNYLVVVLLYLFLGLYLATDLENTVYSVENIRFQLVILTLVSGIFSMAFLLIVHPISVFIIFIINSLLVMLITGLHVNAIGLRFWIVTALFYQYAVKLPFKASIPVSLAVFGILIPIQSNAVVFGFTFHGLSAAETGFLLISECAVMVICHLQQYILTVLARQKKDLQLKEISINNLIDTNLGFQKYAFTIENESRIEERLSITREIHDITGYTLTSIIMMLEHGEDLLLGKKDQELLELLGSARMQARGGHHEIRQALKQLRDIQEVTMPLTSRIYKIVHNFMHVTGMDIHLEFTNFSISGSSTYDNFILRFLQEGLTNSFRHGKATHVVIIFFQEREHLVITFEDNGIGSASVVEGIGLKGMTERIEQQGGVISYSSSHAGFTLIARLPMARTQKRNTYEHREDQDQSIAGR
ncbi:MAG: hypothetical protein K9L73_03025 [Spirochaetia bacterium]|nr:hypothetical protein [Spirochaetia bacterium]